MTTTTKTAEEFAAQLRVLADLYDAEPALPVQQFALRITGTGQPRESFLAVRRLFPQAEITELDPHMVEVTVKIGGQRVVFAFWKSDVGVQQTVTRQVVEYVLPEPVAS